MARKSPRAKPGIFPPAVALEDLIAGGFGAIAGGAAYAVLLPFPSGDGGAWVRGEQLPGWGAVFAWVLALVAYLGFGFFSAVLARVDHRTHTLPNGLLVWATLWTLPLLTLAGQLRGDGVAGVGAWLVTGVITLLCVLMWLRASGAIGAGDVKLIPLAAYAAAWGLAGPAAVNVSFVFLGLLLAGVLVLGVSALIRGTGEVAVGPIVLGASWATFMVMRVPAGS